MLAFCTAQIGSEVLKYTADQVVGPYIYVFYIAFLVAFLFTPVMRAVAIYYGIIDQPDGMRKIHNVPVAYLGGVAVFLGWIAGMALSQFVGLHQDRPGQGPSHLHVPIAIVAGGVIIAVIGLWDDVHNIKPWVKIAGQVTAAVCLLARGIGTRMTEPLLTPVDVRLMNWFGLPPIPESVVVASGCALVLLLVVGCCNATNLMDGLDGLCGGVTAVIVAGFLVLAIHLAMYHSGDIQGDALRVVLGLALLGAVLGFVPYNFNPASIFMGDTGSMFLGYCCAVMIILATEHHHPKWFLASMVIFALPVLDTLLAFVRRWVNKRPIFSADRHHFHHQMVARGLTVKQTVLISYGLAIFFAVAGSAIVYVRTRYVVAFYLVFFGSLIVAAYKMGMVQEKPLLVQRKPLDLENSRAAASLQGGAAIEVHVDDSRTGGSLQDHVPPTVPGAWSQAKQ